MAALVSLVTTGAACGSDAGGDTAAAGNGVASLRDGSDDESGSGAEATAGTEPELEAPEDPEEAFALYDQCLQEHGVDPGEGFVVVASDEVIAVSPEQGASTGSLPARDQVVVGRGPGGDEPPEITPELIEASEACQPHLANATPDFDLTPEQEAAMEDAQLEFQQCMEEHGIEGGGFSISLGDGPAIGVDEAPEAMTTTPRAEVDPEQFEAAAEECRSVYEDYPELDDVFPDGGPAGGVFVGGAANAGGGS
jgi:hypothetical protein